METIRNGDVTGSTSYHVTPSRPIRSLENIQNQVFQACLYTTIVSKILEGVEGVICHMDGIWGTSLKEHDVRIRNALNRLRNAGLTLNALKCEFAVSQIRLNS